MQLIDHKQDPVCVGGMGHQGWRGFSLLRDIYPLHKRVTLYNSAKQQETAVCVLQSKCVNADCDGEEAEGFNLSFHGWKQAGHSVQLDYMHSSWSHLFFLVCWLLLFGFSHFAASRLISVLQRQGNREEASMHVMSWWVCLTRVQWELRVSMGQPQELSILGAMWMPSWLYTVC